MDISSYQTGENFYFIYNSGSHNMKDCRITILTKSFRKGASSTSSEEICSKEIHKTRDTRFSHNLHYESLEKWWHLKSPNMMPYLHGYSRSKRLIFYSKTLLMWITRKSYFCEKKNWSSWDVLCVKTLAYLRAHKFPLHPKAALWESHAGAQRTLSAILQQAQVGEKARPDPFHILSTLCSCHK